MTKHNLSITEYMIEAKKRFMSYVSIPQNEYDCWLWKGDIGKDGYGRFEMKVESGYKTHRAHRISYMFFVDSIPDDKLICHSCDNTLCVNPNHLFLGTNQDNIDDRTKKNRQAKGEKVNTNKLTRQNVYQIREMIEQGYTLQKIASIFGVCDVAISSIKSGKSWKWLK